MLSPKKVRGGLAVALLAAVPFAFAGVPYPAAHAPKGIDLGSMSQLQNATPITITVALKLRNAAELPALLAELYTPGSPQFHQFLSPAQFRAQFAPAPGTVASVARQFESWGLSVQSVNGTLLKVTGSPAQIAQAFNVQLHLFEVPALSTRTGYRYHAPLGAPQLPAAVAGSVQAVFGLDNRPRFRPLHFQAPDQLRSRIRAVEASPVNTPDPPGLWTVTDFVQYYDVQPLYTQGVHGEGRTIGIVTLASFTSSDAFAYWSSLGLNVNSSRLTVVNVDGGPGAPSDQSGSSETTLDVEQSGGIAPGANLIVYQAPNTDQGFVDAFAQAVGDDTADAVSTSWGLWEAFADFTSVTDPTDGQQANELQAFDDVFVQGALEGQSLFAAAGDSGAYDANEVFPVPQFSKVLSVDNPADDPFITAAGGTTLPGPQQFLLPDGSIFTVNVAHEQAWSWDYLTNLCRKLGFDPVSCGIFPVGGGGGVSVFWPEPFYQVGVSGIRLSQPNQALVDNTQSPPQTLLTLPNNFPGRNLPDISLNADPDTGYIIDYTSSVNGPEVLEFFGGTSFVAPQLAGVTALLDQNAGGRVGLLNFALYGLVRFGPLAYDGPSAPLRDIRNGDNWFYPAHAGYDQASGVGVPDVANLAQALQFLFGP